MEKICFVAYGHGLYDDRIYWKQILSLQKQGYSIKYLLKGDKDESDITPEGVEYQMFKKNKKYKNKYLNGLYNFLVGDKKVLRKMSNAIQKEAPSLIHVHDYPFNTIVKSLKKTASQPKLIYDIREPRDLNLINLHAHMPLPFRVFFWIKGKWVQRIENKSFKEYDKILAVDYGVYNRAIAKTDESRVDLVFNYTNLNKETKVGLEKLYDAIYCGNMNWNRGIFTYLEATKIIKEKRPDFKFVMVGKFHDKKLEKKVSDYIKNNELRDNFIITGKVPYQDVSGYYEASKIAVNILDNIPAHKDIMQIKLFEYMNYGLPIITSNFGAMRDLIVKNEVGEVISPNAPDELADKILEILYDESRYKKYSKNGMQAVEDKYNWGKMESRLFQIYKNLLGEEHTA